MPAIVQGSLEFVEFTTDKKIEYKYPDKLNLSPHDELHKDIVKKVMRYAIRSHSEISKRFDAWKEIDKTLVTYMPASEAERDVKNKDSRKPISIVIPASFATLDTLLAYSTETFLDDPIFKYEGVGDEDVIAAILLERVIHVQASKKSFGLNLHTMWRDGFAYGLGALSVGWATEKSKRLLKTLNADGSFGRQETTAITYEGNELTNIDPYRLLPDPNVSVDRYQKGMYFGWVSSINYMDLLGMELRQGMTGDPEYFNVKYLKNKSAQSQFSKTESDRNINVGSVDPTNTDDMQVDLVSMYVKIIPSDWNLGDGDAPEIWSFVIAGDSLLIRAAPLGLLHDKFPVVVNAPDFDGYSSLPIGKLETVHGLQTCVDFLYNSHIANVRKALNDMFIYDPSVINQYDIEDPQPGKLIRLLPHAWGKPIGESIKQFGVMDVTQQNIASAGNIQGLMKEVTGAVDAVQGVLKKTAERVTAQQSRDTMSNALSRLAKNSRITSMMSMQTLGFLLASHTQQLMTQAMWVKLSGRAEDDLKRIYPKAAESDARLRVTPNDILADFDVLSKDAGIQGGEHINSWLTLFQSVAASPEIQQRVDPSLVFMHIARLMGAKNMGDFVRDQPMIQTQVMPDQQVMQEAQRGNIVPTA